MDSQTLVPSNQLVHTDSTAQFRESYDGLPRQLSKRGSCSSALLCTGVIARRQSADTTLDSLNQE